MFVFSSTSLTTPREEGWMGGWMDEYMWVCGWMDEYLDGG